MPSVSRISLLSMAFLAFYVLSTPVPSTPSALSPSHHLHASTGAPKAFVTPPAVGVAPPAPGMAFNMLGGAAARTVCTVPAVGTGTTPSAGGFLHPTRC